MVARLWCMAGTKAEQPLLSNSWNPMDRISLGNLSTDVLVVILWRYDRCSGRIYRALSWNRCKPKLSSLVPFLLSGAYLLRESGSNRSKPNPMKSETEIDKVSMLKLYYLRYIFSFETEWISHTLSLMNPSAKLGLSLGVYLFHITCK